MAKLLSIACSLHTPTTIYFYDPPHNNDRMTLHCYNVILHVASLRHCDIMWQHMGINFSQCTVHLVF